MLKILAIISIVSCGLVAPHSASTCTCAVVSPEPPAIVFLQQADVVFTGVVLAIDTKTIDHPRWEELSYVTFQVKQSWKGVDGEQITIVTVPSEDACGYPFRVGEAYLVYAHMYPDLELGVPMTGLCDKTKLLSVAQEDIAEFNRATVVTQSLWGRIKYWVSQQTRSLHSGNTPLSE